MKQKFVVIEAPYEEDIQTPERNLWMAVIERAMKDFCFFFDKLNGSGKGQILNYNPHHQYGTQSFNTRVIKELNRLRWFLFSNEMEPFNLAFLIDQFYDDSDGILLEIRKVAKNQFKKNFDEAAQLGLFPGVRQYVTQVTAIDTWTSADEYVPLRQKRYRN